MDVYECLRANGWFPGRKNGTLLTKLCLIKEGYSFHSTASAFLEEFGGLAIAADGFNVKNDIEFDACRAAQGIDPTWVSEDYEPRLGKKHLCVIGRAYEGRIVLLIDEENVVYGGFDDLLYHIADDPIAAIERIINNQPLREL